MVLYASWRLYDKVRRPSKPCEYVCVLLDFSP